MSDEEKVAASGTPGEWRKVSELVTEWPWRDDLPLPRAGSQITIAGTDEGGTTIAQTFTVLKATRSATKPGWLTVSFADPDAA